jgi:apolipoprotein D and lipocalin family protein
MFLSKITTTIMALLITTAAMARPADPAVVADVDFTKYSGLWHEVAHSPNFFQKGCLRSTAEYQIIDGSSVSVYNVCYKENGKKSDISGVARVKDSAVPAKLKVKFNFFARGDYWIIDLDDNYQWAVVSAPKKKNLFILSRTFPMDQVVLKDILLKLKTQGFETDKLVFDRVYTNK